MKQVKHKLIYLSTDEIKPNPKNPRKHNRAQRQAIAKSIRSSGFNAPILVDKNKMIVAGHGRLAAAKQLGLTEVPVIVLSNLDEHHVQAYMLADNKLCDRSSWDEALLAAHLKELSELPIEFDVETTGFESPEIEFRIQSINEDAENGSDLFEVQAGPTVTRLGDVWHLGEHILCCGSSVEVDTYDCFPREVKVAAVFADPPYNVRIQGHVSGLGKTKHREFVEGSGEMSKEAFCGFLAKALSLAKCRSQDGAIHFWCMDWRSIQELQDAAASCGLELMNLCVWVKSNGGMGTFYRSRHELILVLRSGSGGHTNNVQLGRFGRNRTNVWHYPGANVPTVGNPLKYHPTPKPIALVADAIRDCTNQGDCVLDPFLGSGTTLLAAEETSRTCYGIELDPIYVDVVITRWQQMTGREARLLNGQTFSEAKAERGCA